MTTGADVKHRWPSGRRAGVVALVVAVSLLAFSCSSSSSPKASPADPPSQAAEPVEGPVGGPPPAGVVVSVGNAPEGLVFDATTGLVAVAVRDPDRLLLLDATSLAVVTTVPLAGHARHLQLAAPGGPVLVPEEDVDTIAEVPLPSGAPVRSTSVGRSPHDAAAVDGGRLVVGNEGGKSISIVKDGTVERTVSDLLQPGGVVGLGSEVAVIDVGNFTLSTYDPATGLRTAQLAAGAGPTHGVVTDRRQVVVADTRGGALLFFDVDPLRASGSYPLPGSPYGMAYDPIKGWVWVTLTALNQVVAIDLSGPVPTEVARYPTAEQPDTVAVAPGGSTVWVTGTRRGQVERISP